VVKPATTSALFESAMAWMNCASRSRSSRVTGGGPSTLGGCCCCGTAADRGADTGTADGATPARSSAISSSSCALRFCRADVCARSTAVSACASASCTVARSSSCWKRRAMAEATGLASAAGSRKTWEMCSVGLV
jgi:hypothetical protein